MANKIDFNAWAHTAAEWSAHYLESVAERPVRAQTKPGDISAQIQPAPPMEAESMQAVFDDFKNIIPDGMTHWQHPRFFAYFPSNAAPAAIIAEQLAAAMSAQCMLWQTSPAATELEISMVDWLRQAVGLPKAFSGVFQDTASSATLCAVLNMRERTLNWRGNEEGLSGHPPMRIYASKRTHSSIDKALWVAGLGQQNLVKIDTDERYALNIDELQQAIETDRANGFLPAGIIACVGGTSMGASDNIRAVCQLAQKENLFTHVDAAWAGSAMICPEYRDLWDGIDAADSIVLNPHKWLGAPMECSAHFVKDANSLKRTLSIQPEYLRTHDQSSIENFSEWSIQLGRRFRALKVWFLFRAYGLNGLQEMIRNHVRWSQTLAEQLRATPQFEIVTEPVLSLFTFRCTKGDPANIDNLNQQLVNKINDDGRIYLTQTDHDGKKVIRFMTGQFDMQQSDIDIAYETIVEIASQL